MWICGECARPGECCDHAVPAPGGQCVPDGGAGTRRDDPHDMPGGGGGGPRDDGGLPPGLERTQEEEEPDWLPVSDARYDSDRDGWGGSSSGSRERRRRGGRRG